MPNTMHTWQPRSNMSFDTQSSSAQTFDFVETRTSQLSAVDEARSLNNRDSWQQVIDGVLIEMGRSPDAFADSDEGIDPPTKEAVATAVEFATFARDETLAPPGQTMPDGDGGVVFQRALPDGETETFEAAADGSWSMFIYSRAPKAPVLIRSSDTIDAQT